MSEGHFDINEFELEYLSSVCDLFIGSMHKAPTLISRKVNDWISVNFSFIKILHFVSSVLFMREFNVSR